MGFGELAKSAHMPSVGLMEEASRILMLAGRIACWSMSVDAADAKNTEVASIQALYFCSVPRSQHLVD